LSKAVNKSASKLLLTVALGQQLASCTSEPPINAQARALDSAPLVNPTLGSSAPSSSATNPPKRQLPFPEQRAKCEAGVEASPLVGFVPGERVNTGAPFDYMPLKAATGFFDDDSVRDVALFSSTSNSPDVTGSVVVTILAGSSQFKQVTGAWADIPLPELIAADFNLDGVDDLGSAPAHALLDAAGNLAQRTNLLRVNGPSVWADVNGDSRVDLVSAALRTDIETRFGQQWPEFALPVASPNPILSDTTPSSAEFMKIADVTGDGKQDLLIFRIDGVPDLPHKSTLLVLTGDGKGGFENREVTPFTTDENVLSAELGDFNCDGRVDWALSTAGAQGEVTILLRNDEGWSRSQVATRPPLTDAASVKLSVGDVNGDGTHDLVVTSITAERGDIDVLLGRGDGSFGEPIQLDSGTTWFVVELADLDGDGTDDVYAAGVPVGIGHKSGPELTYWLSRK
jgi:hypothetical protein